MVKTSTLLYLVDDYNFPSDTILSTYHEPILSEESYSNFLNILEVDPGEDLVIKTLEKLEEY